MTNLPKIFDEIYSFIEISKANRDAYFTTPGAFTRERKLSLENICLFMLSNSNRSLSIELHDFFENMDVQTPGKSSFSKARYRIRDLFFEDWNRHVVDKIYGNNKSHLTWRKFRLKGIDGSTLYLFEDEKIQREFGGQDNQFSTVPMARLGFEFDLLNGYCTQAAIHPYQTGEDVFAKAFLSGSTPGDLNIYDRGFPSYDLVYRHLDKGVNFVMRAKCDWNKAVNRFAGSKKKKPSSKCQSRQQASNH